MLSAVLTMPPGVGAGTAAGNIGDLIESLSEDVSIPSEVMQVLDGISSGVVYQAFPGEVNDVSIAGGLGNMFLHLNESMDVNLIRGTILGVLPPFSRDVLDLPAFDLGLELGPKADGGPVVVFVGGNADGVLEVTGDQIKGAIKQVLDLTDARAIIFNGGMLLDLFPTTDIIPDLSVREALAGFIDTLDQILDLDLRDIVPPVEIEPLIRLKLPLVGTVEIPPEETWDIVQFLEDMNVPTSLRDMAGLFPGLTDFVDIASTFIDYFTTDLFSNSVYISTLDGPDNITFEHMTGMPIRVYAGGDDDTIRAGGGVAIYQSYFDAFDLDVWTYDKDPAKIELFGDGGEDTFIVGRHYDSLNFNVDGGVGNDRLVVEGTPFNDIIEVSAEQGMVREIRFISPDPNGGVAMNEIQRITLPAGTDSGTFTLTYRNQYGDPETTNPISWYATEGVIKNELELLDSIGNGDVLVEGPGCGPWFVTFTGDLGNANQRALTSDASGLGRTGGELSVHRLERGDPDRGTNEVQKIQLPPHRDSLRPDEAPYISGGTFTLEFDGHPTDPIPSYASKGDVQAALEDLDSIEVGDIRVTGNAGGPWFVEFTGDQALTSQSLITFDPAGLLLTGGIDATVAVKSDPTTDQPIEGKPLVQEVELPSKTKGGTFTLSIGVHTTGPLPANASSLEVHDALAALPDVGDDRVSVTGPFGGPWEVTLSGKGAEAGGVTGDVSGLSGGISFDIDEVTNGSGQNQIQVISTGGAPSGTFQITFDNGTFARTTGDLFVDATPGEIQTALEGLTSVGEGNVIVTGDVGGPWSVEFIGDLAASHQLPLELHGATLPGPVTFSSDVTELAKGGPGVNEQQLVEILPDGAAIGGTFRLTLLGFLYDDHIPFDVDGAELEAILNSHHLFSGDYYRVTGPSKGPYTIEYIGGAGETDWGNASVDVSNLVSEVGVVQEAIPGTNEVQTITPEDADANPVTPTGGTFMLQFDGVRTGALPYNARGAQVQAALEALPGIGQGNVSVVGGGGGPWTVEFVGDLAGSGRSSDPHNGNLTITYDASDLIGGFDADDVDVDPAFDPAVDPPPYPYVNEVQTIKFDPDAVGGTFTIRFTGDERTVPLDFDAPPTGLNSVQKALEALPSVGVGNVQVTGTTGDWEVTFVGDLAATDVPNLIVYDSALRRGEAILIEREVEAAPQNEIQRLTLPADVTGGDFTLAFHSLQITETTPGDAGTNEVQRVALPADVTGGYFRLSLDNETTSVLPFNAGTADVQEALARLLSIGGSGNVLVEPEDPLANPTGVGGPWKVTFTGALGNADQELLEGDGADLSVPISGTISHNATPSEVQLELEALSGIGTGNVRVTGGLDDPTVARDTRVDELAGINEVQTVTLPDDVNGGFFTLTFDANPAGLPDLRTTAPIAFDASVGDVEAALEALSSIDPSLPTIPIDVTVTRVTDGQWEIEFELPTHPLVNLLTADGSNLTSRENGPWTVEFIGTLGAMSLGPLTADGALLEMAGGGPATVDTIIHGGDGENVVISTKRFGQLVSVEQLVIEGGAGDDRLIVKGAPEFGQGIFFDGGDGTDYLELISRTQEAGLEPAFVAPVFPGDDQGTVTFGSRDTSTGEVQGTAIQFAGVEGEVIFDGGTLVGEELPPPDPLFPNEIQRITIPDGTPAFTITVDVNPDRTPELGTTGLIPSGADAIHVMNVLNAVPVVVDSGYSLVVTTDPLYPGTWDIEFVGEAALKQQQPLVTNLVKSGYVSLSGTDDGDDMRFAAGPLGGSAAFARGAQVRITLENFSDGSSVELLGQQGDDTISIALNGVTEFGQITAVGGGPAGTDAIRFEGTRLDDEFTYTPGALRHTPGAPSSRDATVTVGGAVNIDALGFEEASIVGLGGTDGLTVFSPAALLPTATVTDIIRFFPEPGHDGSILFMTQSDLPETAVVYSPVSLDGIETRHFDSGTGADTLHISTDNVPGVSLMVDIDGGDGVATLSLGDQTTLFTHDTSDDDLLIVDVAATQDETVTGVIPGVGLDISLSISAGQDILTFFARDADVTVNMDNISISQPGYGDVTFIGTEDVGLVGDRNAHTLTFDGPSSRERFVYTPLGPYEGSVEIDGAWGVFSFEGFEGDFFINGGGDVGDEVVVAGSHSSDVMRVDGPSRTVSVVNSVPELLKPVTLGDDVEVASLDGLGADDIFQAVPSLSLLIEVHGDAPNASDRLVVQDAGPGNVVRHHQGADGRSGSIFVGPVSPVAYTAIERVDILPLDPVTGGTGDDGLGRIVVFHADRLEQNDSRLNPTELPDLFESTVKPNIDPGGVVDPFGTGLDLPGDEDWYRYIAPKIGTYRFEVLHEPIGQLPAPNLQPGLPGDGKLMIWMYHADGTPIDKLSEDVDATHTIGVNEGESYLLRVRGVTPEVINIYDIAVVPVDTFGPQVTDVYLTNDPGYDLFDPKPSEDGPTPLAPSLTVRIQDLPERFPGFLYGALDVSIAEQPGHYRVVGDHNGVIAISNVIVINDPVVVEQVATASIILEFYEPLPDDRFTLTISDSLTDPPGLNLDGENNAVEPQESPLFPTGDAIPGGVFEARFTIDSRAEIGTWSAGSAYVDTNGNFLFDPQNLDFTNRDIVYTLGFTSDDVFAGNFQSPTSQAPAEGFDKLAAYGEVGGVYRWLVDTTNDGVPNLVTTQGTGAAFNGLPVAGDFDGDPTNGDEVGLFTGTNWLFDTDRDFVAETSAASTETGLPIVGDFDGDEFEDLGLWRDDQFFLSLSTLGGGVPEALGGTATITTTFNFGFIGVRERPVAADMDGDGIDDIGLWVPDRSGALPEATGEWYFLISDYRSIDERLVPADPRDPTGPQTVEFTPVPFGKDRYAQWGDEFAIPVVGNFDPPVTAAEADPGPGLVSLTGTADDDTFELMPGPTPGSWIVTLNGAAQSIEADTLTVTFDGGGGSDTVVLVGGVGDDVARLWPGHGTVTGDGYSVALGNVETVSVDGGGGGADLAFLRDNPAGKDTLTGGPDGVTFAGDGYSNQVTSFRWVHVYGTAGYADAAQLQGGPGERDTFEAWPEKARLEGDSYLIRTNQISYVSVAGQPGDVDVALLHDDPATADTFEGRPDVATLSGDAFSIEANSFPYVHAYGTAGGGDVARFYDNPDGFDKLVARPDQTRLFGEGFLLRAKSFGRVRAWSTPGTGDLALLHDASTDDTFTAWPDRAELFGPEFDFRVNSFGYVHAYATGGADAATLYGSAGRDVFVGTDRFGKLRGSGYFNRAVSFEQVEVHGGGGRDVAVLRDAVLESGVTEPLDTTQLAWLYEFERIRQRSDSGESIVEATDEIFTAYWQ